jgi:hypothetical protein
MSGITETPITIGRLSNKHVIDFVRDLSRLLILSSGKEEANHRKP